MSQYTGEYEQHLKEYWKPVRPLEPFSFYTFTPRPLMDGGFFELDDELFSVLTMTHRKLGVLEGMIKLIPDSESIRDLLILKECHYSRLIDYDGGGFFETLKAINVGKNEAENTLNIASAYRYSLEKHVNNVALSKLCTIVLYGHNSDIKVRERDKFIFLSKGVSNLKEYNPTAPDKIRPALADISGFLLDDDKTDVLVKAALAHYQFEMIHPFECYNGIVGRIMFPMILHSYGIKAAPFIGLSELLYSNKNDYFNILSATQYSAGYIALIKFFVWRIYIAAERSVKQMEKLVQIIAEDEAKVNARGKNMIMIMVYDYFKRHLVSEIKPASEALGVSFNAVAKAVESLMSMCILRKDGQQSRHRVFVYDRFLNTLVQTSQSPS